MAASARWATHPPTTLTLALTPRLSLGLSLNPNPNSHPKPNPNPHQVGYVPIHYLDKSVAFEELCALYFTSNPSPSPHPNPLTPCHKLHRRALLHLCRLRGHIAARWDEPRLLRVCPTRTLPRTLPLPLTLTLTLTPTLTSTLTLTLTRYVACQGESKGVLVLSEFAGAAQALGAGCVRVNPYNTEELARGMHTALSMEHEQRGNA